MGIVARNYLHYGYIETKLGAVTNAGPARREDFRYATHHPVMFPVLMSLTYRMFGINEASGRLVPILFTLAGLLVWYRIGLMQWDRATAAYGLFFLALFPSTAFFGSAVNSQSLSLFFALASVWWYLRWVKTGSDRAYAGMIVTVFVGTLSDWPAYLIVPVLVLHRLAFTHTIEERWKILALPVVAVAGFGVFLAHIWTIGGVPRLNELYNAFAQRSFVDALPKTPGILTRILLNAAYAAYLFTPFVLVLSVVWLAWFCRKVARGEPLGPDALVICLLGFGLIYPIVFASGTVHAIYLFLLGPFIAASGALATGSLHHWALRRGRGWAAAVLVVGLCAFLTAGVQWRYLHTFRRAEHMRLYRLGVWIEKNTDPSTTTLVLRDRELQHSLQLVIAEYYAERNLLLVGPEGAGIYLSPSRRSPGHRYLIVPEGANQVAVASGLRECNWPRLDGFACFELGGEARLTQQENAWGGGRSREVEQRQERDPHRAAWRVVMDRVREFWER